MRNLSSLHRQQRTGWHWPGSITILLVCCALLLSSCSGLGGGKKAGHAESTLSRRTLHVVDVNALLKVQGLMRLETFQQWVNLMKQYKGDTSVYQRDLLGDQMALGSARTDSAYREAMQTLDRQVKSIRIPALKSEGADLEQRLAQQASAWGQAHTYHDDYNNTTYQLGYEYNATNGVAGWVQDDLSSAKTLTDYQQAIDEANMFLTNFRAYRTNAGDKTPWNQAHQTDLQLMRHYQELNQKVIVVSLSEQVMRVYDKGSLVKAFKVTTGRPEKPSVPGNWWIESKQSPTVFKSDEPPGSLYWYPNTPITYAMLYHSGGYFLHDSWWRSDYGPGTQFPHVDSSGDSFSYDGSHGCVNIEEGNAAWLYHFVDVNTHVIIY